MTSMSAAGASGEPIAIIGLACRVPGAGDGGEFWRNLVGGVESIEVCTLEQQAELGVPQHWLDDPYFVPVSAGVDDVEGLDAAFFGMSAPETEIRDPQHRLFLELAHSALEDSGYDPARYPGEIGVYAGSGEDAYQWLNTRRDPRAFAAAGPLGLAISSHSDYVATFASFKLNLRGPSLTVHTACSSSLVAIHIACEALRNGECDIALGGGVNIDLPLGWGYMYFDGAIYSPDGHTRTFDARAAGTMWSDGGGVIVLRRLADALADGDHVRAVILGNAINNDGRAKVGFTAPSQEGQATVIAQALAAADVDPRTISYLEAHGTGTAVGDPIEVAALSSVYQRYCADTGWCAIGSVKTNVGHLGPAAGVTGVIKTVLALEHELIPPTLNYESPNPKIGFAESPFRVAAELSPWQRGEQPRRAGVSSFGVGGTNAHLIVAEAPAVARRAAGSRPAHLVMLSARTPTALGSAGQRLAARLTGEQPPDLADAAYTLRVGRRELPHRLAVVARDPADAAAALASSRRRIAGVAAPAAPKVAFMFSGQGAQYPGMGRELYAAEPAFRDAVDECCAELTGLLGEDLRELMFAAEEEEAAAGQRLQQTAMAQPALFSIEYALARLWQSWGVEPAAMAGHSIGEYVAATLAGVFSLPDALHVVAARGRLMQQLPPGAMLAVQLDEAGLRARLPDLLSVAAVNGPRSCVVSGPAAEVARFASQLDHDGVGSRALRTSHAFHSRMMDPVLAGFRELVAGVPLHPPRLEFLSNVTGDWITPAEAADPSYWARHLRETVRFGDCLAGLLGEDAWLLVECGPGRQLCGLASSPQRGGQVVAVPSLPGPGDRKGDAEVAYAAAGRLWAGGIELGGFGDPGYRVPLPGYPWERQPYWIKPQQDGGAIEAAPDVHGGGPRPVDEWFAVPSWRQLPLLNPPGEPIGRCLVFGTLAPDGVWEQAVRVLPGAAFGRDSDGNYRLRPGAREDYDALVADLAPGGVPARIVHAWALDGEPARNAEAVWQAQESTFFSLLALVQALAKAGQEDGVHLDVLTAGTADVTGGDLVRPEQAVVAGIAKVAPLELPWLSVRHIDTDPGDPRTARRLAAELAAAPSGDADGELALRGGRRWRREYQQVTVPASDGARTSGPGLRDGGVYVITGGLGGIGITLAEALARDHRAGLVLVSRTGLDAGAGRAGRARAAIARMEAAGAQVLVLAADVATAAGARQARDAAMERFGRVDGIVHAAGVAGGGMAEVKERGAAEDVLAPKVLGTLALRDAFGDLDLDFVLLCSSATAIAGGFGQVDYCAANSFLDAYARSEHGWKAPVVSVNWGGWRDVGMAAEVAAPAAFRALQRGDRMTPVHHPVLTGRHEADDDGTPGWCGGTVSPDTHWVLGEHRLAGAPVMPGTGYLEVARCAFAEVAPAAGPGQLVELRDVAFTEPMAVPDGSSAELRVIFTPATDGLDFQVASLAQGVTRIHARGTATWADGGAAPAAGLDAIRQRCSLAVREGEPDSSHSAGMVTFGSRWGNVRRTHVGRAERLTLLEAGQTVAAELGRWVLHPALLDEATSSGAAEGTDLYLPLGYGSITVHRPLPARLWSHLRRHESATTEVVTCDITLFDETGAVLASIGDFTMRRVDRDAMTAALTGRAADADEGGGVLATAGDGGESVTGSESAAGIRPADGAEAFRRLVATDLGPQVVIAVQPVEEITAAARQVTHGAVEDELGTAGPVPGADPEAGEGRLAPRTELEAVIARLWAEVLGSGQVGVTDNFFASGGNSLVAVQIIALIRKKFGVRLSMRKLFEDPTVAGAAQRVAELRDK